MNPRVTSVFCRAASQSFRRLRIFFALRRPRDLRASTFHVPSGPAIPLALLLSLSLARAQFAVTEKDSVTSISGQFVVTHLADTVPPYRRLNASADTNLIALDPALLAVAADRFKYSLWWRLGLSDKAAWSGRIHLRLHTAVRPDEMVNITSTAFLGRWFYVVDLPDVVRKTRYARALASVLLLELANRMAPPGGHSAELPPWLVDGLAQHVLAADGEKVLLAAPKRKGDELAVGRLNQEERGYDPLAGARRILQNAPALTFDQLSWPGPVQADGADGGVYLASAQLLQSELLGLNNGAQKMRTLLADLPTHLNWQTAFFQAYGKEFSRPLDVEKWWALRVVNFASQSAGPCWTTDVSINRMNEMLSVAVESRSGSNALPVHGEITLQAAVQSLNPEQRDEVLRVKVRDLALAELRLAPPFGGMAEGYRLALAEFLGELPKPAPGPLPSKQGAPVIIRASARDTLKKLDALDLRRRDAETRITRAVPTRLDGIR